MSKIFSKNKLLGFSPELHWDLILMIMSFIAICVSGYLAYIYISLNNNIIESSANSTGPATTKEEISLQKIVNIETVLSKYRQKEVEYNTMLGALIKRVPVVAPGTTSTSSVASSTVR